MVELPDPPANTNARVSMQTIAIDNSGSLHGWMRVPSDVSSGGAITTVAGNGN